MNGPIDIRVYERVLEKLAVNWGKLAPYGASAVAGGLGGIALGRHGGIQDRRSRIIEGPEAAKSYRAEQVAASKRRVASRAKRGPVNLQHRHNKPFAQILAGLSKQSSLASHFFTATAAGVPAAFAAKAHWRRKKLVNEDVVRKDAREHGKMYYHGLRTAGNQKDKWPFHQKEAPTYGK